MVEVSLGARTSGKLICRRLVRIFTAPLLYEQLELADARVFYQMTSTVEVSYSNCNCKAFIGSKNLFWLVILL